MATKMRLYLYSPPGTAGIAVARWDSGLLPDAPIPGLTDLSQLPQGGLVPIEFGSYEDLKFYAEQHQETLHAVNSVAQAVAVISGRESIPTADSDSQISVPLLAGVGAAAFFLLRKKKRS